MSNPPYYQTGSVNPQTGYYAAVRPPVLYAPLPPLPAQYEQPTGAPQQMSYTPYPQQAAQGQAPYAPMRGYNRQMYNQQGSNIQATVQYSSYQHTQPAQSHSGPYHTSPRAQASTAQTRSTSPTVFQDQAFRPSRYQSQHQNGQGQGVNTSMSMVAALSPHQAIRPYTNQTPLPQQSHYSFSPPLPSISSFQTNSYQQRGSQVPPQQSAQRKFESPPLPSSTWSTNKPGSLQAYQMPPSYNELPSLSPRKSVDNTTQVTSHFGSSTNFTAYRSEPSGILLPSRSPPRPTYVPKNIANTPNTQSNGLPRRPMVSTTSSPMSFTTNSISDFGCSNATSIMGAFEPRKTFQMVTSEPVSSQRGGSPVNQSSAGTSHTSNERQKLTQDTPVTTTQQKPSLDIIKAQVAAAKRRLEEISNRKRNSLPSEAEKAKIKTESEGKADVLQAHNAENIAPPQSASVMKTHTVQAQRAKNNVNSGRAPALPRLATSTSRTPLSHPPEEVMIKREELNLRPAQKLAIENATIGSSINTNTKTNPQADSGASVRADNIPTLSATEGSNVNQAISDSMPIRGPAKPTVLFIRPGKIVHTARKLNGSSQMPVYVERSVLSKTVVERQPLQLSGPMDSLGLKYLESVSDEEGPDQAKQSSGPIKSETEVNNGLLIKAEPAPLVQAQVVPTGPSALRRQTPSSVTSQDIKPELDFRAVLTGPRNTRRHFTAPTPSIPVGRDPDPEDFMTGTSSTGRQKADPDLDDFLAATSSVAKVKFTEEGVSEKLTKGSSLGRYFKKSFVEASLIGKSTSNKIRIANVKMRPDFETGENPKADQSSETPKAAERASSLEDGEIIESHLPFDYTSTGRPNIARPSIARPDSIHVRNHHLSYDEPALTMRKKNPPDDSLWSSLPFPSGARKQYPLSRNSPPKVPSDSIPSSPPLAKKRPHSRHEPPPYILSDIPSDIDMDDTIVVDCSSLFMKSLSSEESEEKESAPPPPRKKRLVRRSEIKPARVSTGDELGESSAMKKPLKREIATKSQASTTKKSIRYATEEEMKQLTASIEVAQFDARTVASHDKPDSYERCIPESNWQPYKCFECQQKWSLNVEIAKHLENRHSIILPRKFKAWQCFFPECPKSFCDRNGALKHAKSHFKNV